MAIEYTVWLKSQKVSDQVLTNKLKALGYLCDDFERMEKGVIINLNEKVGFTIFLFDAEGYPYNCRETVFLDTDFVAQKILKFRMIKNYFDSEKPYKVMLRIIFDILEEVHESAILVGSGDTELCFFREDNVVVLNNESGIWDRGYFKDTILNRMIWYT